MKARCVKCGYIWSISILADLPRKGYICPYCCSRIIKESENQKKYQRKRVVGK